MIILALAGLAIFLWKWNFINDVYFRDQLTSTGLLINGVILGLFSLGMLKMIGILFSYLGEERALTRFVNNIHEGLKDPLFKINKRSLIARRYSNMLMIHKANSPVDQSALAATLVAAESTRNVFPRFINNILILSGVFGTIVSLSIALIGASDLLASSVDVSGMGMVIHGMSTALSTTITAIVCYLLFGYFFMKLTDVQTNLISAIEQVSSNFLMPRFQVQADSVLYEFSGLVRALQSLVKQMHLSQKNFQVVEKRLVNTLDSYRNNVETLSTDMTEIKQLLRLGFRLPESGE